MNQHRGRGEPGIRSGRRTGWFVVALIALLSIALTGIAGQAGAEKYDPKGGQTIDPPVKPIGPTFDQVAICTPDGVSIEIAKGIGPILGRDIYQKDKPVKGENGYNEHLLVIAVQSLWLEWSKANPGKKLADFFKDDAVQKAIRKIDDLIKAAIKANPKIKNGDTTFPNGDTLAVWCVDKNANHGGPALGYYFKPNGKDGVWVGLCKFDDGLNNYWIKTDEKGNITQTQWVNYGIPDDSKDVFILVFTYDVATNSLTIEKIWGRWSKDRNGKWTFGAPTDKTLKNVKETIKPAPTKFEDLKLEGRGLLACNGCGGDAVALADLGGIPGEETVAEFIEDFLDGDNPTPTPTGTTVVPTTGLPTPTNTATVTPTAVPTPTDTGTYLPSSGPRAANQVTQPTGTATGPFPSSPGPTSTTAVPTPTGTPTVDPSPTEDPGPSCDIPPPTEEPTGDPDPTGDPAPPADLSLLPAAAGQVSYGW